MNNLIYLSIKKLLGIAFLLFSVFFFLIALIYLVSGLFSSFLLNFILSFVFIVLCGFTKVKYDFENKRVFK